MSNEIQTLDPLSSALAFSSSDEYSRVVNRWTKMIRSGALPERYKNAEQVIAVIEYGASYGWGPMRSLNAIYLVKGNPSLSAQAMRALAFERIPGAQLEQVSCTHKGCVVKARRCRDDKWVEFSFTEEDAKAAGSLGRAGPWRQYPGSMYFARASALACRRMFSDAVEGAYATEELRDPGTVTQVRKRIELPDDVKDAILGAGADDDDDVIEVDHEPAEEQGEPPCEVCSQQECKPGCPGIAP